MTNKEKYKKAFDVLASSEQISLEVENMANKKRKKSFMAITVAAVIVFGTLTVGAAAYYNWSNGLSEKLRIDEENAGRYWYGCFFRSILHRCRGDGDCTAEYYR